jgi:hypothetical protein
MIHLADAIEAYLTNYPDAISRIALQLRSMVRHALPGAHEFLYYETISYSLSDSPIERICYISPSEKYVSLGFSFGARLNDQDHLLKGHTKRARHVKLKTMDEAKNKALKKLVEEAWTDGANSVPILKQELKQRRALTRKRSKQRKPKKRATRFRRRKR